MRPRDACRATALVALPALIALAAIGCSYSVQVGRHDGGGDRCGAFECRPSNQCVCGQCVPRDAPAPACNPSCETARAGDLCTDMGRRCAQPGCNELVCVMGTFHVYVGGGCDGGVCTCPAEPPNCRYVPGSTTCCGDLVCDGERCGRDVCGEGLECCNASCGTCGPPGTSCIELACPLDCSAQDAQGEGGCALDLGVIWNGRDCVGFGGCSCSGADCDDVFRTVDECRAVFDACNPPCGTIAGLVCEPERYCDYDGEPNWCGAGDGGGRCILRPDACIAGVEFVCGCDGITYTSPCGANAAGTDVAYDGACGDCDADDARGTGGCDAEVGQRWTGTACEAITGCACDGADCGVVLGRNAATCARAHVDC